MPIVQTLKQMFTADERIVYRCDDCGQTFDVGTNVDDPPCAACGSTEVRQINRV
jgi:predicted nucleic acid-binding Zn ribbon protein